MAIADGELSTSVKHAHSFDHAAYLGADRFRANEVRLPLSVLAYNLGNLWRKMPPEQSTPVGSGIVAT